MIHTDQISEAHKNYNDPCSIFPPCLHLTFLSNTLAENILNFSTKIL